MAHILTSTLDNGLRLFRIGLEGTHSATVLVAFDAGARSESKQENGIAHFLEHLVFKGGRIYPDYRSINRAAESLGAVMNAYTSHELVAFHITVRAEAVLQAVDLLTDFVARPRIDVKELERERGVIVQEIARAHDQPSRVADDLIDRVAFGDHPLGRTVLGPAKNIKRFTRDQVVAFRKKRWGAARGAAFVVGNLSHAPKRKLQELFLRFGRYGMPAGHGPAPPPRRSVVVEKRDTNQSHLRLLWRPQMGDLSPKRQAALALYATLLGGSMGSRLHDEIREQRGLCYSISAFDYVIADAPLLYVSSGLQSDKCQEAYECINEVIEDLAKHGPKKQEFEQARAYATGKRILAYENTLAVARYAARQVIAFGESPDPTRNIDLVEKSRLKEVAEVAESISGQPVVACVGPQAKSDFK